SVALLYGRAVELDPRFALAFAKLSQLHSLSYFNYIDRSDERLVKAKAAADTALRLAPELPEAHLALGFYYYYSSRDYSRALREFATARAREPNNSDLLEAIGLVERRQGRWAEALADLKRAAALDPRSGDKSKNVADTDLFLRAYAEAIQYWDRTIALRPDLYYSHS